MIKRFLVIFNLLFCLGCSANLDTLIKVSNEQKEQKSYVELQNQKFNLLLKDISNNKLKPGLKAKEIISLYGEPISVKPENEEGVYLYRNVLEFFPAKKVYLYFDREDKLKDFKVVSEEPRK